MGNIDFTSFEKAYKSLIEVTDIYNSNQKDLIVRDSMIQRFEYTYSLALKMIKRYFSQSAFASENVEGMTFNEMIRNANKMGLLKSNLETWDDYRLKRNMTSHTYDEEVAISVVSIIQRFESEASFLLAKLKEKTKA